MNSDHRNATTYVLTEADVRPAEVVNVATISGTTPAGETVNDDDSVQGELHRTGCHRCIHPEQQSVSRWPCSCWVSYCSVLEAERNRMKAQRGMITLAVAALALTACGSAEDDAQSSPRPQTRRSSEIADQPGSVEDYVGAVEDAEVDTCAAGSDGLEVAGTVTNPESDPQDYRLYISAMTEGDTVGLVQVDVADVAGETAEWRSQMDLAQEGR